MDLFVASWFLAIVVNLNVRQDLMDVHKDSWLFRETYLCEVHEDVIFSKFFCGLTCLTGHYNKKTKSHAENEVLFH